MERRAMVVGTKSLHDGRPAAAVAMAVCLLALAALALACGDRADERPSSPVGEPDILGVVTGAEGGANGEAVWSFLIDEGKGAYDKASVTVSFKTGWFRRDAEGFVAIDAPTTDDLVGTTVEVRFTGPVAESYPVQATAAWVIVGG